MFLGGGLKAWGQMVGFSGLFVGDRVGVERLGEGVRFGRRGVGWGERRVGRRFLCVRRFSDSVMRGRVVGRC